MDGLEKKGKSRRENKTEGGEKKLGNKRRRKEEKEK